MVGAGRVQIPFAAVFANVARRFKLPFSVYDFDYALPSSILSSVFEYDMEAFIPR